MTNRLGYYANAFSVELWRDFTTDHLPTTGVTIRGNTVYVANGSVQQVMGGIQFYAGNAPFSWGYYYIRRILDAEGNELWHNSADKDGVSMAQMPFHKSIVDLMDNYPAAMDANAFVAICRLVETTRVPEGHQEIMDTLERLALSSGHQFMNEFHAARKALEEGQQ